MGENNGEQSGAAVVLSGTDIKTQNLTVDGTNLSYTVSNATTTYSMINEITVADGASWKLYSDIGCTTEVVSKTVSLNEGDNIVYVLVTNGTDIKLYTITLRRRPTYTVTFNTNEGLEVEKQNVEEGFCATEPNVKKIDGYSLTGKWDLDFSVPIQKDTIVTGAYTVDVKLSEDGTTVTGVNNDVEDLVILSEYNGVTVTKINDFAFSDCILLTSITIPDSVTEIGESAFEDCVFLTNITIPNSVKHIGESAFFGCISLMKIMIPDTVTSIGDYAFEYCSSLTSVTIGSSVTRIGESAFSGCDRLVEVINKSKLTITKGSRENGCIGKYVLNIKTEGVSEIVYKDGYLFYTYDNVNYLLGYIGNETSLTLLENYNGQDYEIYKYAFSGCGSLTSITIPDSVTSIGNYAFYYCRKLTSVTIGNNVTSIGDGLFYNCSSLMSITIPNSVTSILSSSFYGCSSLQYNQYDNACYLGNTNNPYLCLIKSKSMDITSCTINENCKIICSSAFSDCSSLESINVDKDNANYSSVDGILYNKSQTEFIYIPKGIKGSVTIPDTITSIGSYTFSGCSSLTSVTIPNGVTSIGSYTLYYCRKLTSVTIPNSVTSIGNYAFSGCSSLESVTIPNNVTSIGDSAFSDCSSLESINVDEDNANYSSVDGILYNKSQTEFIHIPRCIKGSVTIPDTITSIKTSAFGGCSSLESVTIGNGVISIGYYAFYGCSLLTDVTFENPNGWYVSRYSNSTSGTNLTLTDAAQNATYLKSTYYSYYWKRG